MRGDGLSRRRVLHAIGRRRGRCLVGLVIGVRGHLLAALEAERLVLLGLGAAFRARHLRRLRGLVSDVSGGRVVRAGGLLRVTGQRVGDAQVLRAAGDQRLRRCHVTVTRAGQDRGVAQILGVGDRVTAIGKSMILAGQFLALGCGDVPLVDGDLYRLHRIGHGNLCRVRFRCLRRIRVVGVLHVGVAGLVLLVSRSVVAAGLVGSRRCLGDFRFPLLGDLAVLEKLGEVIRGEGDGALDQVRGGVLGEEVIGAEHLAGPLRVAVLVRFDQF